MAKSAVITGGSGFVGTHLARALADEGVEVTSLDPSPPTAPAPSRWVEADVRDAAAVDQVVRGADVVYHLASVVGVDACLGAASTVIDVIVTGTRNVLESADRHDVRVVALSSSEVLGRNPDLPWTEESDRVLGPTSTDRWGYASAKAVAEHLAIAWHRERGLPVTVVRPFNAYGEHQRRGFVVVEVLRALLSREAAPVDGDGSDRRCYTYVADLVDGIVRAADEPLAEGEVIHLGSTESVSVLELVDRAASILGVEPDVRHVDATSRHGRGFAPIGDRRPAVAKAATYLGWEATTSLEEGLARTAVWIEHQLSRPLGAPTV